VPAHRLPMGPCAQRREIGVARLTQRLYSYSYSNADSTMDWVMKLRPEIRSSSSLDRGVKKLFFRFNMH
jgi:hypothetical protein